jgi:NAD(P)-dependent dehydrogenase (short-subunit alcohol dehydrogenase family)
VRAVGTAIARDHPVVHVLANNAGALTAPRRALTVNHLAGFLLAHLLLRALVAGRARLVTTASLAEAWGWLDGLWDANAQRVGATMPYSWILR